MKRKYFALPRWLAAAWLRVRGCAACRKLAFDKYRIDLAGHERNIERKLRRKVRKSFPGWRDATRN